MNTPFVLITLCAGVLSLAACDKTPTVPPTPMVNKPVQTDSGAAAGTVVHQSVPSAESVLPPANSPQVGTTPARSDGTRNPAQQSTGALMPGQNNDHSAPLAPAKRASTP